MANPILDARERRWNRRRTLAKDLAESAGQPSGRAEGAIVSLTLRMPCELRASGLYDLAALDLFRAFSDTLRRGEFQVSAEEFSLGTDGPEGCISVFGSPTEIKKFAVQFEDINPLGKLIDIDAMDSNGAYVGRADLGLEPRKCFICGEEAHVCSAGRTHSAELVAAEVGAIFMGRKGLAKEVPRWIGQLATEAALMEAAAHPKPGLVTPFSPGAHADMDYGSFLRSAAALAPWFSTFAEMGYQHCGKPSALFPALQEAGKLAETDMFAATGGVNTLKGLVFSLGLLAAASGVAAARSPVAPQAAAPMAAEIAAAILEGRSRRDASSLSAKNRASLSSGERIYLEYGVEGVLGEVSKGFPSVLRGSLPRLRDGRAAGLSPTEAMVDALLVLYTVVEDTNVLSRAGLAGLDFMRKSARRALTLGGVSSAKGKEAVEEMNRDFVERGISPGGSADLLAVTLMFDGLSRGFPRDRPSA